MIRLFVAIDLPEKIKSELSLMCCGMPGARWVDYDQMHLTISFIGEVDGRQFEDISYNLESLNSSSFNYTLKGVGHFPPRGMPNILWVGVEADEELKLLKSRVEASLRRSGVQLEKRKYSPHVTLARLKNSPRARVANFLAANNLYRSEVIKACDFHLYSSVLTSKGALHTIESSYELV